MDENALFEQLVQDKINDNQYKSLLNNKDFIVGARVRATRNIDSSKVPKGREGIIVLLTQSQVGVYWDKKMGGHTCRETCKEGHGWFVSTRSLELIN